MKIVYENAMLRYRLKWREFKKNTLILYKSNIYTTIEAQKRWDLWIIWD